MIIERLSQEHRNIEKLLAILERELEVFDRGDRPDYEVIRAIISYFEVHTEIYHHPQEELVFAKLKKRDPAAAAKLGDLSQEHRKGSERLRLVAHAVENVGGFIRSSQHSRSGGCDEHSKEAINTGTAGLDGTTACCGACRTGAVLAGDCRRV